MKQKLIVILLLSSFYCSTDADAQFWKRKKKEKKTERKATPPKPAATKKDKEIIAKKKSIDYPKTIIKNRYRIDVLLSLYLEELVVDNKVVYKNKLPNKAVIGVNFFEGITLASEALSNQGYNIDVYIHDITQSGLSPQLLVANNSLEESDLIIGAVQSSDIKTIADYAKKEKINFISALSPADAGVTDNPYFTILQPTLATHIKKIKAELLKKYHDKRITLIYRNNNNVDSLAYQYSYDKEDMDEQKWFNTLSANKYLSSEQLSPFFDSTQLNVIFMPIINDRYAQGIIENLHAWFPSYQFEVYGLPSWKAMSRLRIPNAYPNVAVNYTSPFYYDMNNPYCSNIAKEYKKIYYGTINEMTFRGYETLMWYSYLLKRYGTIFNEKVADNAVSFSKYEVTTQWTKNNDLLYNENTHYYLYRYQSGSYIISQN